MAKAAAAKASPVKKVKKGGKNKDPNAPKRAMSAFFFWMQENRERIKKPGMGVADVAKAAGVEWGKLTDKSKWEKKAADDRRDTKLISPTTRRTIRLMSCCLLH
ncbi:Protein CBG20663 [Caenorhabditis briggsae]|uniref:Protein CBG20663 n=1 Tax=Caenorhabditis briggsae TaxID=6238 RepID=A8XYB3_CAEBR|nr:Protein CBG20663 [Caenorhabditis briggsae]CAP37630.2 Protein CBG20663 [Caenorhabditis briggsae]